MRGILNSLKIQPDSRREIHVAHFEAMVETTTFVGNGGMDSFQGFFDVFCLSTRRIPRSNNMCRAENPSSGHPVVDRPMPFVRNKHCCPGLEVWKCKLANVPKLRHPCGTVFATLVKRQTKDAACACVSCCCFFSQAAMFQLSCILVVWSPVVWWFPMYKNERLQIPNQPNPPIRERLSRYIASGFRVPSAESLGCLTRSSREVRRSCCQLLSVCFSRGNPKPQPKPPPPKKKRYQGTTGELVSIEVTPKSFCLRQMLVLFQGHVSLRFLHQSGVFRTG